MLYKWITAIRFVYCIEYLDCVVCSVCSVAVVAMHGRGGNWFEYC